MKAVILAGGRGTRFPEETATRPKPMIEVCGRPILWHIMSHYARHGITDFVVCGGYKWQMIEEWASRQTRWSINVVDTGEDTLTGGRLAKIRHLVDSTFCMTYGDGVSDIDIGGLLRCHGFNGLLATVTAVHFAGRFGVLEFGGLNNARVTKFSEKSHDWINGGFFVLEPEALDHIDGDVAWEQQPLHDLVSAEQLAAYPHRGFWQCMDTLRDRQLLEEMWDGTQFTK